MSEEERKTWEAQNNLAKKEPEGRLGTILPMIVSIKSHGAWAENGKYLHALVTIYNSWGMV